MEGARILVATPHPAVGTALVAALGDAGCEALALTDLAGLVQALTAGAPWDGLALDDRLDDASVRAALDEGGFGGFLALLVAWEGGAAAGADKVFRRPVVLAEVVAGLCALAMLPRARIGLGGCALDATRRVVLASDGRVGARLTEQETRLLVILARAGRAGAARATLLRQVWGYGPQIATRTLETHIHSLRRKLALAGAAEILSTTDTGYALAKD